jgi:hypothetical protein
MKLRIEINLSNEAFADDVGVELDRVLATIKWDDLTFREPRRLYANNGNHVGTATLTDNGD